MLADLYLLCVNTVLCVLKTFLAMILFLKKGKVDIMLRRNNKVIMCAATNNTRYFQKTGFLRGFWRVFRNNSGYLKSRSGYFLLLFGYFLIPRKSVIFPAFG